MMIGSKKGSSIIEYTVLIAVFCAALAGMEIYTKRAIQGHIKATTDSIGNGEQFSADWSKYSYIVTANAKRKETITPQGKIRSELLEPEIVHRSHSVDSFSDKALREEKLFE